jgi:hypothetical protein
MWASCAWQQWCCVFFECMYVLKNALLTVRSNSIVGYNVHRIDLMIGVHYASVLNNRISHHSIHIKHKKQNLWHVAVQ